MKKITLDIMKGVYYYKTLTYTFAPPICKDKLVAFIEDKLPSLKGKSYDIVYNDTYKGVTEPVWINVKRQ